MNHFIKVWSFDIEKEIYASLFLLIIDEIFS